MRPMRALMYAIGVCGVFSLPSLFIALSQGFDRLAIGLVSGAFAVLLWIALMHPAFGTHLAGLRTTHVLRIVIAWRVLGSIVPFGCMDLWSGLWVCVVVERGPFNAPSPSDFTATAVITLGQGMILVVEFLLISGLAYLFVRYNTPEHNPDICRMCGYDIRASREIGRCPECGTPCLPPEFAARET